MQEKEQKISPIKQRILQFADTLNISKRDFYLKIGVSRGTLESKTGITEEVLAKFIAAFPEVSIDWLMQGEGGILKHEHSLPEKNPLFVDPIQDLTHIIRTQAETLLEQQQFINAHFPKDIREQKISTPPLADTEKSPDIEHLKG